MVISTVLVLIALASALMGFVASIWTFKVKLEAERHFLQLLGDKRCATELRALRTEIMRDGVASYEELDALVDRLDRVTLGLSQKHRAVIRRALRQQHIISRARYVAMLLNRAGIGSGAIPVPIA